MNLTQFLPKIKISEDVFGSVYDIIVSGESPAMVRISDGVAWENIGDEYRQINDPVDWLLSRNPSIPSIASRSVSKMVPMFKPMVAEYISRFCKAGGKALIEFHGPEKGGISVMWKSGDEKQIVENEEIRLAFTKYMFENQQNV